MSTPWLSRPFMSAEKKVALRKARRIIAAGQTWAQAAQAIHIRPARLIRWAHREICNEFHLGGRYKGDRTGLSDFWKKFAVEESEGGRES